MKALASSPSLLEVVALHPDDAVRAQAGGADRLHVCALDGDEARSVEPAALSAIVRATDLPVRATLRLSDGFTTQGGEFARIRGLASDYLALGVEGFAFGFLTRDLEVDVSVCLALAEAIGPSPWTFDHVFDHALEPARAWREIRGLPGLDGVQTAGAALGMALGFDDLLDLARREPAFAALVIAADGVQAEHIPWLVRAGVRRVHLGACVRPGQSWGKSYVDPGFVRSWRLLLDDATRRVVAGVGDLG